MAVLIRLTQTAQDETTVTYRYGPTWDDQPRTVSMNRETGEPLDTTDHDDLQVAGWLTRERRVTGGWIPKGQIVS